MRVKLNGEELEVAAGLTFGELIEHVRDLLRSDPQGQQALVELRLDGETVSQARLEELSDRPLFGEIELFALNFRELAVEAVRQGRRYLERLEGLTLGPEALPELLEGFDWLNRALALIPRGLALPDPDSDPDPELEREIGRRLARSIHFCERLARSQAREEELKGLQGELAAELAAYHKALERIEEMIK